MRVYVLLRFGGCICMGGGRGASMDGQLPLFDFGTSGQELEWSGPRCGVRSHP